MAAVRPAILCGGIGSRLWPLSSPQRPKQFHALTGEGALPAETRLAGRLAEADRLATWAELWESIGRLRADALALQLDRKAILVDLLTRLTEPGLKAA